MSYYYEDTLQYCYSAPAYYEDTSQYCYSVPAHYDDPLPESDPVYFDNTPTEPVYYDDIDPEPIYYDETTSEPSHYVDNPSFEELEAYAEAASNRTYHEDEIHPAYRDHPEDHIQFELEADPPIVAEPYYEDEIHSTYLSHPPPVHSHDGDSPPQLNPHVDPPVGRRCVDEQGYYWTTYTSTNSTRLDPPSDPTFYDTASHDQSLSEDLRDTAERIKAVLEEWREWDHWDRIDDLQNLIEERKPRHDQLVHLAQHIDGILRQRAELDLVDEALEDPDDNNNLQLQSTSPTQSVFDNLTPTLPPDICIPDPLPLSPNIQYEPVHHTSAFLITAIKRREPQYYFGSPIRRRRLPKPRSRTTSPPDIRTPQPFPPAPNIPIRLPYPPHLKLRSSFYQQPRRPAYTRPRRKHPPARPPSIPTSHSVDRRHSAIRRILKKNRSHSF